MKALLKAAAAAASLFFAGAASAAPTTVEVAIGPYTCDLSITKLTDSDHKIGKVLLAGTASDCEYKGAGDIGKVRGLGSVATLTGASSLLGSDYQLVTIFEYPFVDGGIYWAYYTGDGKTLHFLNKGTYSVK
jgi:hypothetical protein